MTKETLMFDREGNLTTDSKKAAWVEVVHRSEGGTVIRREHFLAKGYVPKNEGDEWQPIPNEELTEANIPGPSADWSEIRPFAYSFRGYDLMGSLPCPGLWSRKRKDERGCKKLSIFHPPSPIPSSHHTNILANILVAWDDLVDWKKEDASWRS